MAGALEHTACCRTGHAGCHILSKAIFTIPSFSPWTFLMLRSCVQKHPLVAAWLWHCVYFPGVVSSKHQLWSSRRQLNALLSLGGQPPQVATPARHRKPECQPHAFRFSSQAGRYCQGARADRWHGFADYYCFPPLLFFFFCRLFLTLLWKKFIASLLSHNYFHSYALEFQLMIHKFLNKAKDSQLSGSRNQP